MNHFDAECMRRVLTVPSISIPYKLTTSTGKDMNQSCGHCRVYHMALEKAKAPYKHKEAKSPGGIACIVSICLRKQQP